MAGVWSDIARVRRTRQEAEADYNRLSHWYRFVADPFERRYREAGLAKLAPREGERVLEVGPGTGESLVEIAQRVGPNGLAVGVDLSEGMCRAGRDRLREAGIGAWGAVVCGDGARLPFPAGRFDALFTSFTLELFDTPEIPRFLAECRRALAPGGRIGVVSLSKAGGSGLMVRLYEWAHRLMPRTIDCRPIYAAASLREAGFQPDDAGRLTMFGLPVEVVLAHAAG